MDDRFIFIEDDNLRQTLEADAHEVEKTFKAGAWKACLVLAGSIIECLLTYLLIADGRNANKVYSMALGSLAEAAESHTATYKTIYRFGYSGNLLIPEPYTPWQAGTN